MELKVIAHIETGFSQKFGIPRQSGLVTSAEGRIIFEKEYRDPKYIDGIEGFDYIWLLWEFSANKTNDGATVRPPRMGGQKHMGVFATRAPYRPNNIGLSSVKIKKVEIDSELGPVITVAGVDMLDGTPIYDIKPYLPYADSHPKAAAGFTDTHSMGIEVEFPMEIKKALSHDVVMAIEELLAQDPRPAYDRDKEREYKVFYGGYDVIFEAKADRLIVKEVTKC